MVKVLSDQVYTKFTVRLIEDGPPPFNRHIVFIPSTIELGEN